MSVDSEWSNQPVITPLVIIFGTGASTGLFIYSGTPKLGNGPIFWASSATTDPFGNAIPTTAGVAGTGTFKTLGAANSFVELSPGTPATVRLGTGDAAEVTPGLLGTLINGSTGTRTISAQLQVPRITGAGSSAGFIRLDSPSVDLTTSDGLLTAQMINIAGTRQMILFLSPDLFEIVSQTGTFLHCDAATNVMSVETQISRTQTGFSGYPAITQVNTSTNSNANNGTQPITTAYTIPAGDGLVGTSYEIWVPFDGTFQNQTLAWAVSLDNDAGHASNAIGAGFFVAGTAFRGQIRAVVRIATTGAGGTADFFLDGGVGIVGNRSSGTNNNNAYLSSEGTGVAFDTTVSHTLKIITTWGGSTAGQTVSGLGSEITRTGS